MLLADDSEPEPPRRLICAADAFAMVDEAVAGALDRGIETVADHVGAVEGITVAPEGLESWFETLRGGPAGIAARRFEPRQAPATRGSTTARRTEDRCSPASERLHACTRLQGGPILRARIR